MGLLNKEINSLLEKLGQPEKYDEPEKIKEAAEERGRKSD